MRPPAVIDTLSTVVPSFAPVAIEPILEKAGTSWTHEERDLVVVWLNSQTQLDSHLRLTLWYLGRGTTAPDAEDTWQEFCLHELGGVIRSYVPAVSYTHLTLPTIYSV